MGRPCKIAGCMGQAKEKGYCHKHYMQFRRNGYTGKQRLEDRKSAQKNAHNAESAQDLCI